MIDCQCPKIKNLSYHHLENVMVRHRPLSCEIVNLHLQVSVRGFFRIHYLKIRPSISSRASSHFSFLPPWALSAKM